MASLRNTLFALAGACLWSPASGSYVWPNEKTDQLENLLYEQTGFMSQNLFTPILNCTGAGTGGRNFAAEWLRNAYHDMATANVFTGVGGLDASIAFETNRPENVGASFNETLGSFSNALTTRSTMSDMFALGAVAAVGVCSGGTVQVPLRAGRVDAAAAGPSGVPQPQEDLATHTAAFDRQGFSATEMIALVACGHTIGGVHGVDFPQIVPITDPSPGDDNVVTFDTTTNIFENRIAIEYSRNTTQNPLVVGQNVTTRSDQRIFSSDGGKTLRKMAAANENFISTCTPLLERMINTVPKNVQLSDIIAPVLVKPRLLAIAVNANGTMTLTGTVRVANSLLSPDSQVAFKFSPRSGSPSSPGPTSAVATGTTSPGMTASCVYSNCGPGFTFYDFETEISAAHGVSSFVVEIFDRHTKASVSYDNGGQGFPFQDTLQPQLLLSNQVLVEDPGVGNSLQLNLTVAVYDAERFQSVVITVPQPNPPNSPVPSFVPATVAMSPASKIPGTGYTLYTGLYSSSLNLNFHAHPYDVVATGHGVTVSNTYNSWSLLPVNVEFI